MNRFNLSLIFFITLLLFSCAEKKIKPLDGEALASLSKVIDLSPSSQTKNIFIDKSEEYGLGGIEAVHHYAVDVNNDGATDLVILDEFYSSPKFYYFNKKLKKFELGENPFNESLKVSYMVFLHLDRDGILDVVVGNLNQKSETTKFPARVYKGQVKNRTLTYKQMGVLPTGIVPTASIVPIDFNLDGELDLYLANWFSQSEENSSPVPDMLFQGKGFEFENVSHLLKDEYEQDKNTKAYLNATPTFGVSVCDVDGNGFPDILTSNSNGYFNKLWLNFEGTNFINYGQETGYAADNEGTKETRGGGYSFFNLCGDYNNDGLIDVVVGNLSRDLDSESRDKSSVLTGSMPNFPPQFFRTEFFQDAQALNWVESNRQGVWIDYNLDGLKDMLIANSGFPPQTKLALYEQENDHAFDDVAPSLGINLGNPSGIVTIDLNQDGIMDFISGQTSVRAGNVKTKIFVYENQTKRNDRGSIRFHLRGQKSNYHGLSSMIIFSTDKKSRRHVVQYSSGNLPSQNEEGIYFAFDKEVPKSVEVKWTSGKLDRLNRIVPLTRKYDLTKFNSKGRHLELTLCEDGRVLKYPKRCY